MPTRPGLSRGAETEGRVPSRRSHGQSAAGRLGPEEEAFDLWLRRSLHEAFDPVAAEPVPEDILRMIEEDRAGRERLRHRRGAKREG